MLSNAHDVPCRDQKEISDATLVERAVDGSSVAFETLVCRYRTKFLRLAQGIVEGESDAQDVLQRALIKIHDKLDTLRDPSSFGSWAYRVVKNTALMRIRKQKRNAEIGFGDLGDGWDDERHYEALTPDYRGRADEAFEVAELREHLSEAVEELEPKYQSVFVMYEFEGMELEEIGGVLDLTAAGVKSRLHRARLYLRATLERYVRE